ncbi:MAG: hypothetical protein AB7I48_28220 [Planctomycetaceae bacterium]
MKSTLWKLTALAGVMGAGFLVVYQAQTNLSQKSGQSDPEGAEEFRTPGTSETPEPQPTLAETMPVQSDAASRSDRDGARAFEPPPQRREPNVSTASEPTRAIASRDVSDSFNPFADDSASEASPTTDSPEPEVTPERSRFAELVSSFSDLEETPGGASAQDKSARQAEGASPPGPSPASESEAHVGVGGEPTPAPAARSVNPFASETLDPSESPSETKPLPEPRLADDGRSEAQAAADFNPFAADPEPPSLTRLDAEDGGPQLSPPPVDATAELEWESKADESTGSHAPEIAAATDPKLLAPDKTLFTKSANTYFPKSDKTYDVAQASNEQPASTADSPNPFLVLPGGEEPTPASKIPPSQPQEPTLATTDPQPNPAEEPALLFPPSPLAADRDTHAEGKPVSSREFTITPRSPNDADPFSTEPAGSATVTPPTDPTENQEPSPFGAPPPAKPPRQVGPAEPSPFPPGKPIESRPSSETSKEPPKPASPLPARSITGRNQPVRNEVRPTPLAAEPVLRPEDLRGVGTIGKDSPVGTQQAQVTIEKEAPANAAIGQPLIYSIHVRNIGRAAAENVVIKDVTPRGSRLVGTSPQAELDEANSKLIWRLGKIAPGDLRTIKVKVVPTTAGQIGSIATVSFEAAVAARTVITAPELRLTIDGPEEVGVGEKAAYRFTLTNAGSADASGAYIRNLIPEGFEHPRGGDLEYDIGILHQGQSKEVELTLLAVKPGKFENRAILAADGNVSVDIAKTVSILASRLSVHREGPADRFVGRSARFTNTITNESSGTLAEVTVVEMIPAGIRFEEASDGGVFDPQRSTVTWRLRQLGPGVARPVHVSVIPTQAAELATTVKAFDSLGHSAEVTSRLRVAGFSSLKVDFSPDGVPVPVGEEVAFWLSV